MFKKLSYILIFILLLTIVACGDDDDTPEIEGADQSNTTPSPAPPNTQPTETVQPDSENNVMRLTVDSSIDGGLMFTWNETLYFAPFDGQPVQTIAENITLLDVSEDHQTFIYYTNDDPPTLTLVDVNTQTPHEVMQLDQDQQWNIQVWSPDNRWFVIDQQVPSDDIPRQSNEFVPYVSISQTLVGIDGTSLSLPPTLSAEDEGAYRLFQWLSDGSALMLGSIAPAGRGSGLGITTLWHIEPTTQTLTEIEIDDTMRNILYLFATPNARDELATLVADLGYELADTIQTQYGPSVAPDGSSIINTNWQDGSEDCNQISLVHEGLTTPMLPDIIYEGPNFIAMSTLNALTDSSLVFLQWISPNCQTDRVTQSLVHIPDAFITDAPDITTLHDIEVNASAGCWHCITVSPDQQYAVWISSSAVTQESSLLITDLATGDTESILTVPVQDTEAEMWAFGGINQVYWAVLDTE